MERLDRRAEPTPPALEAQPRIRLETSAAKLAEIAAVRHAVAAYLRNCGSGNVHDAVLVISEMVTNAVLHAGGADRILVDCDDAWINITVHDNGPAWAEQRVDAPHSGGHGLHIVDRLAQDWGSTPLTLGKEVWAKLPSALPPSGRRLPR